ncbi:hypothetical protein [Oceanobacillus halophilus]|uniref:Uncharacterized protein n=1 Tax=Oceanobacillus halophilus TaxID=930130 RepID=A0A495A079_9BACI|nr:hypothetical protein [Oceanobacillus halophilus]RKQ32643.1 hypothetical protein D8M06_11940 [Oceanobacillus halophilus]
MKDREKQWIDNLRILEKHLEKNEKWLQRPEEKIKTFEKNAANWNRDFNKKISDLEESMKYLEKRMEN